MTEFAADLYCGLGGWTEGFLAAGCRVFGFDNHRHSYGEQRYPAQLILQDALTIHGSQLKDASVIVASPPCQNYSYLAMPWSRSKDPENSKAAKALRKKWETEGPDNRLFDACFRIQREAIEATRRRCSCGGVRTEIFGTDSCAVCHGFGYVTRYIPLIVENVRGAVPWVGKQQAQFGSFYLWGDVAQIGNRVVAGRDLADIRAGRGRFGMGVAPESSGQKFNPDGTNRPRDSWFAIADSSQGDRRNDSRRNDSGHDPARSSDCVAVPECDEDGMRESGLVLSGVGKKSRTGGGWFGDSSTTRKADPRDVRKQPDGSYATPDGTIITGSKQGGDWFGDMNGIARHGSRSNARKAASAMIAKIPLALSRYIAEVHMPQSAVEAVA